MEDRRISSSKNFEQPNGFSEGDGAQRAARAQSNRKEQATIGESGACDGNNSSFSKLPCKALDNESMRGTMGNLGNVTARDLSERPLTDLQGGIMEFVGSEDAFSLAGQQVHSEKQDMEVNSPIKPIADQRKKKETALETTGQGLDGKIKATGQWKRLAREKGKNKSPGDFNEILSNSEKQGGTIRSQQQMDGFRKVVDYCAFQDLGYCGSDFTWRNMQDGENRIYLRLDRALANLEWLGKFGGMKAYHVVDSTFDHCALLISDSTTQCQPRAKRFHFEALWTKNAECKTIIENSWGMDSDLSTSEGVMSNLSGCAVELTKWSSKVFGQISKKIQEKRNALNTLTLQDNDGSLSTEINCLRQEINDLLDDEEIYWGQRAKAHWLKEDDKNTSFFHAQASERRKQNTIFGIWDSCGRWCERQDSIVQAAIDYFDTIYASASPSGVDEVFDAIPTRVTEEMNESLNRSFTREGVAIALKQIHPTKALGPDENQSAFIPDRLITDNVLVAFELMHYLNHKNAGVDGYMAAKLDMSKAFDRVEWSFIKGVMEKLGFSKKWTDLIMRCISSVSYSVLINGVACGNVTPTRGLRGCPRVTHLLFADDSILFCKASVEESQVLKHILQKYENASGQKINTDKSLIFFSPNTTQEAKEEILANLSPMQDTRHTKYLGLPSFIGRSKTQVFAILKERIGQKLAGWKGKLLSLGGKEILIKAVAQAIPTYTMGCFLLPQSLCEEIESMMRNFWWG
ncbi:uncharacterized protein LOC112025766 [Quercus suber]|uniref:uncharacterized protein LOC112025766 n=1 Tax=Quercus suber TaxID=58331 RepID=UPI000CE1FD22|nr:uncharacterized protein LOC112025766 [Quercus suber]